MLRATGLNTHRGAQNMHKMLQAQADFPTKQGAVWSDVFKKAELPSLSDYVYPVLMDVDPA